MTSKRGSKDFIVVNDKGEVWDSFAFAADARVPSMTFSRVAAARFVSYAKTYGVLARVVASSDDPRFHFGGRLAPKGDENVKVSGTEAAGGTASSGGTIADAADRATSPAPAGGSISAGKKG